MQRGQVYLLYQYPIVFRLGMIVKCCLLSHCMGCAWRSHCSPQPGRSTLRRYSPHSNWKAAGVLSGVQTKKQIPKWDPQSGDKEEQIQREPSGRKNGWSINFGHSKHLGVLCNWHGLRNQLPLPLWWPTLLKISCYEIYVGSVKFPSAFVDGGYLPPYAGFTHSWTRARTENVSLRTVSCLAQCAKFIWNQNKINFWTTRTYIVWLSRLVYPTSHGRYGYF